MLDLQEKPQTSVTLEQLLQLKRAERPAPEFWDEFDRELRRRQLASFVSIKPWYERFALAATIFLKRAAPVGAAAAALAAGIISVNKSENASDRPIYTAGSPSETQFVLLPEEHVVAPAARVRQAQVDRTAATSQATSDAAELSSTRPRYGMTELGVAAGSTRSYLTVSSPVTFSAPVGDTDVYMVNTLTATPVFESGEAREAASF